jgi:hypothetical protein
MASLYEFTSDTSSSASSTYSIYDEDKYASVPKSLYEYNTSIPISIPFDVDSDVAPFKSGSSNSAPAYACESIQEKNEGAGTSTLVFDSDSDSEVDGTDVDLVAPPAYYADAKETDAEKGTLKSTHNNKLSFLKLASIFSRCLSRRPRSRSSPSHSDSALPPPYVSQEEIELMEERMRQLDIFFGGAPL